MGMAAGDGQGTEPGAGGPSSGSNSPTPQPNQSETAPVTPGVAEEPEGRPWAAVVQIITILVIGGVVVVDLMLEGDPVPTLVYGILAGIALGIEPSTFKGLFRG